MTKRVSLIMTLEDGEKFKFKTRTGMILVDELRFRPDDFDLEEPDDDGYRRPRTAGAAGSAIKQDGKLALFDRRDNIPFSDIPPHLLNAAVRELNNHKKVTL